MILTSLKHAYAYEVLGKRYRAAFEFLRSTPLATLGEGKHLVEGEDVFALVQTNAMKPRAACRWEAHRKYADIQYIVSGVEGMAVAPAEGFEVEQAYDEGKDVGFYRATRAGTDTVCAVGPGEFALFLPHDVHMPLIDVGGGGEKVLKVVMKVRV